jgi:hypothetical protein
MSAVKANSPLPSDSGESGSARWSVGLWRATSARRSMREASDCDVTAPDASGESNDVIRSAGAMRGMASDDIMGR